MTWKSTVALSGFTLVAVWLGVDAILPLVTAVPPRVSTSAASRQSAATNIQHEAARLHVRLQDRKESRAPTRNPFRFVQRRAAPEPLRPVVIAPPQPPTPVMPVVTLAGIADDP